MNQAADAGNSLFRSFKIFGINVSGTKAAEESGVGHEIMDQLQLWDIETTHALSVSTTP